MSSIPTLYTPRLCLRPFTLADSARVQQLAGDCRIAATTMNVPHPYADGLAEAWIAKHEPAAKIGGHFQFAITLAGTRTPGREHDLTDTGHLIGAISLIAQDDPNLGISELGYWIGAHYWNKGFATEASNTLLTFGFTKRNLSRIVARHFAINPASGRVMQKLGMTSEGTLRAPIQKNGEFLDVVVYSLLRDNWLRRRSTHKIKTSTRLQPA